MVSRTKLKELEELMRLSELTMPPISSNDQLAMYIAVTGITTVRNHNSINCWIHFSTAEDLMVARLLCK